MKRIILSMSIVLATAMSMQAEKKGFPVDFTLNGLDYQIQETIGGSIGTVWVSDSEEPYVTGTVTIPASVTYNSKTYYVKAVDEYWPMENGLTKLIIPSGVDSVCSLACSYVKTLQAVDLSYVVKIGKSAFDNCGIKELELSGVKLKQIGQLAFAYNKAMTKLTIAAQQLTVIPDYAFVGCEKLENISLGLYVTTLGKQAFSLNPALKTITLPASLTSMGDEVFYNDENLKEIKVLAMTPPTATSKTFSGLNTASLKVIVPVGTVNKYKSATGWKNLYITDGTQAVDNVDASQNQAVKTIKNGQIFISIGEKTYTATGQKVQ